MNRYLILCGGLLLAGFVQAQTPVGRNSIRLGVDLTSLDAPDDVGPRYVGRLTRHSCNDRVLLAAEAGYLSITSANQPFNGLDPGPDRRKRLTGDLTVLVDFLRHPRHALRLGGGLSAWYRQDDLYRGATNLSATGDPSNIAIDRFERSGLGVGWHVTTEYEWLFDPRWGVDARFRVADMNRAGISSVLGVGVSYRF